MGRARREDGATMRPEETPPPGMDAARAFRTTHWSLVLAARHAPTQASRRALEELCRTYWYPAYAFVRRRVPNPEDAQDLTQGFFARVLETGALLQAEAERGRFRTFLLTLLTRYMGDAADRAAALKRGGGAELIALDAADAEARYALEPVEGATPERLFERQWADALLRRVLARLQAEFDGAGRTGRFDVLKGFLVGGPREESYAAAAARLGMSESAVTSGIHRLRQRYGALLREEIRQTVGSDAEVEDEIRHLLSLLAE